MTKTSIIRIGLATALACAASGSFAKQAPGQKFIVEAAQGNLAEIEMGQMAQQNGGSDAVRTMGRQLVQDHTEANQRLMAVASSAGVTPPTAPNKTQKATVQKLSKLSGDAFDRQFAMEAVKDHKKDIRDYQKEAKKSNDPASGYANDTLPTLQKHLDMAQALMPGTSKGRATH